MFFLKRIDVLSTMSLLKELRKGETMVIVNSNGGEIAPAMDFVRAVKEEGLEKNLSFDILSAQSAAAYVVLSIKCDRVLSSHGDIMIHGGRIEAELNEALGMLETIRIYYQKMCDLVKPILSPPRMDAYLASNRLELTREEIHSAGIIV